MCTDIFILDAAHTEEKGLKIKAADTGKLRTLTLVANFTTAAKQQDFLATVAWSADL